jgi:hypothetical protein
LLNEGLGLDFHLTANEDEFIASTAAKIHYSCATAFESKNESALVIQAHAILFDHGIKDYPLEVLSDQHFKKIFFKNNSADLPFDIFAAAFWLITRYEEYLPHKTDQYNRFNYRSSLAYQYDFIQIPLINLWLTELKQRLLNKFPSLIFRERSYNFLSSIDVDNAYQYKYKGMVRTFAGFISDKSLFKIGQRFSIVFRNKKDPFDCYDFLIEAHKQRELKAIFFFLLGDYGDNDKNHSATNLHFQTMIKHIADYAMVGIHPSFGSNNNLHRLKVETGRLSNITHKNISKSRQHFSVLKFPNTYNDLLQAGIVEDYSMGYTNFNGFRASYCFPFRWYNLDLESQSSLKIHPFCMTENSVLTQAARENKSFTEVVQPLLHEVKKYGGQFISIFHNDTFSDEMKRNYIDFLEFVK